MSDPTPITPAEARRLWVEALRSGEYEQGREYLHSENTYCCLGVACSLYSKHVSPVKWTCRTDMIYDYDDYDDDAREVRRFLFMGCHSWLPWKVRDWLALSSTTGGYCDGESLASNNDNGMSFSQIAALIESNPPGLFVEEERA